MGGWSSSTQVGMAAMIASLCGPVKNGMERRGAAAAAEPAGGFMTRWTVERHLARVPLTVRYRESHQAVSSTSGPLSSASLGSNFAGFSSSDVWLCPKNKKETARSVGGGSEK